MESVFFRGRDDFADSSYHEKREKLESVHQYCVGIRLRGLPAKGYKI